MDVAGMKVASTYKQSAKTVTVLVQLRFEHECVPWLYRRYFSYVRSLRLRYDYQG